MASNGSSTRIDLNRCQPLDMIDLEAENGRQNACRRQKRAETCRAHGKSRVFCAQLSQALGSLKALRWTGMHHAHGPQSLQARKVLNESGNDSFGSTLKLR